MTGNASHRELIHAGGPFNARVYRVAGDGGARWIEKDFSASPWIVRHTVGRFLVWRECWILRALAGTGIVPGGVRRLSPAALREEFVEGPTLHDILRSKEPGRRTVPDGFFEAFEAGLRAVHAAGFVHLDLHNSRNVMVAPGGRPVLIDWQSALPTFLAPGPLRRSLEKIDWAGFCKFLDKLHPGDVSPRMRAFLDRQRFLRKHFWIPRVHRG